MPFVCTKWWHAAPKWFVCLNRYGFIVSENTGLSGRFSIKRKDLLEAYEARINFCQRTERTHLLSDVIPEYLEQIFVHCAAAKRTKDENTCIVFEQYAQNAKRQYAPLIEQYAPHLWATLRINSILLSIWHFASKTG